MAAAPLLLAMGARATVAELLRQQDVDLFDAHYYYPDGVAAALLSKWFNKPLVVTGRGTDLNLIANFRIPLAWIRWTERNANASILVSEALKQRLASLSGTSARLNVVRNGVDTTRFFPIDRRRCRDKLSLSENRWILAVGNLVPEKGLAIAIDALNHLPSDTRLAIVGEGSDRPRLERLVSSQRLGSRVLFAGRRDQSELPYWYGAAELLVLCSEREGLPNVLLESMACGTPVVARAVGGVPEIVNNSEVGRLVVEGTAHALAAAISDIFRNRPTAEEVRKHVSKFSWEEATHAQLTLFRSIAKTSVQTNPSVAHIS